MERVRTEEEDEEDEAEELFPFLLKDWRDSCLVIASITEAGTFTGNKIETVTPRISVVSQKGFFLILTKSINDVQSSLSSGRGEILEADTCSKVSAVATNL